MIRLKDYGYKIYQIYNFTLKDHPKKSNYDNKYKK